MIRVTKPKSPAILTTKGAAAKSADCALHDYSLPHRTGKSPFKFKSTLYAAKAVKDALLAAQHGKCAFCESRFTHIAFGDVEHFRPKGGFKQQESDELQQPGYFWLAYEWSNLFASCQLCNQQFKKNLFPLKSPKQRARSHNDSLKKEKPLLIDPAGSDPETLIGFREEFAFAVDDCKEGVATIDTFGLNRDAVVEARREKLGSFQTWKRSREVLRRLVAAGNALPEDISELEAMDRQYPVKVSDMAEYAAMIRSHAS